MKIYDIDTLLKNEDGYYDLTQSTFQLKLDGSVVYLPYTVQKGEDMRIDLICESIYGDIDYIDILCNVNNIDNPLNIKEGTVLLYPLNKIDTLRYSNIDKKEVVKILSNSNKSTRSDNNRSKYIENNLSLPPTILEDKINQFNINSNDIILGDGLF